MVSLDLPLVFALVLAFGIALYVVMDGFDLGLGTLFLLAPSDADRDAMMNSIAPIWDGNETWLVLGGTLLIAAFPTAYIRLEALTLHLKNARPSVQLLKQFWIAQLHAKNSLRFIFQKVKFIQIPIAAHQLHTYPKGRKRPPTMSVEMPSRSRSRVRSRGMTRPV